MSSELGPLEENVAATPTISPTLAAVLLMFIPIVPLAEIVLRRHLFNKFKNLNLTTLRVQLNEHYMRYATGLLLLYVFASVLVCFNQLAYCYQHNFSLSYDLTFYDQLQSPLYGAVQAMAIAVGSNSLGLVSRSLDTSSAVYSNRQTLTLVYSAPATALDNMLEAARLRSACEVERQLLTSSCLFNSTTDSIFPLLLNETAPASYSYSHVLTYNCSAITSALVSSALSPGSALLPPALRFTQDSVATSVSPGSAVQSSLLVSLFSTAACASSSYTQFTNVLNAAAAAAPPVGEAPLLVSVAYPSYSSAAVYDGLTELGSSLLSAAIIVVICTAISVRGILTTLALLWTLAVAVVAAAGVLAEAGYTSFSAINVAPGLALAAAGAGATMVHASVWERIFVRPPKAETLPEVLLVYRASNTTLLLLLLLAEAAGLGCFLGSRLEALQQAGLFLAVAASVLASGHLNFTAVLHALLAMRSLPAACHLLNRDEPIEVELTPAQREEQEIMLLLQRYGLLTDQRNNSEELSMTGLYAERQSYQQSTGEVRTSLLDPLPPPGAVDNRMSSRLSRSSKAASPQPATSLSNHSSDRSEGKTESEARRLSATVHPSTSSAVRPSLADNPMYYQAPAPAANSISRESLVTPRGSHESPLAAGATHRPSELLRRDEAAGNPLVSSGTRKHGARRLRGSSGAVSAGGQHTESEWTGAPTAVSSPAAECPIVSLDSAAPTEHRTVIALQVTGESLNQERSEVRRHGRSNWMHHWRRLDELEAMGASQLNASVRRRPLLLKAVGCASLAVVIGALIAAAVVAQQSARLQSGAPQLFSPTGSPGDIELFQRSLRATLFAPIDVFFPAPLFRPQYYSYARSGSSSAEAIVSTSAIDGSAAAIQSLGTTADSASEPVVPANQSYTTRVHTAWGLGGPTLFSASLFVPYVASGALLADTAAVCEYVAAQRSTLALSAQWSSSECIYAELQRANRSLAALSSTARASLAQLYWGINARNPTFLQRYWDCLLLLYWGGLQGDAIIGGGNNAYVGVDSFTTDTYDQVLMPVWLRANFSVANGQPESLQSLSFVQAASAAWVQATSGQSSGAAVAGVYMTTGQPQWLTPLYLQAVSDTLAATAGTWAVLLIVGLLLAARGNLSLVLLASLALAVVLLGAAAWKLQLSSGVDATDAVGATAGMLLAALCHGWFLCALQRESGDLCLPRALLLTSVQRTELARSCELSRCLLAAARFCALTLALPCIFCLALGLYLAGASQPFLPATTVGQYLYPAAVLSYASVTLLLPPLCGLATRLQWADQLWDRTLDLLRTYSKKNAASERQDGIEATSGAFSADSRPQYGSLPGSDLLDESALADANVREEDVALLADMGFPQSEAEPALRAARGNLTRAVELLSRNPAPSQSLADGKGHLDSFDVTRGVSVPAPAVGETDSAVNRPVRLPLSGVQPEEAVVLHQLNYSSDASRRTSIHSNSVERELSKTTGIVEGDNVISQFLTAVEDPGKVDEETIVAVATARSSAILIVPDNDLRHHTSKAADEGADLFGIAAEVASPNEITDETRRDAKSCDIPNDVKQPVEQDLDTKIMSGCNEDADTLKETTAQENMDKSDEYDILDNAVHIAETNQFAYDPIPSVNAESEDYETAARDKQGETDTVNTAGFILGVTSESEDYETAARDKQGETDIVNTAGVILGVTSESEDYETAPQNKQGETDTVNTAGVILSVNSESEDHETAAQDKQGETDTVNLAGVILSVNSESEDHETAAQDKQGETDTVNLAGVILSVNSESEDYETAARDKQGETDTVNTAGVILGVTSESEDYETAAQDKQGETDTVNTAEIILGVNSDSEDYETAARDKQGGMDTVNTAGFMLGFDSESEDYAAAGNRQLETDASNTAEIILGVHAESLDDTTAIGDSQRKTDTVNAAEVLPEYKDNETHNS